MTSESTHAVIHDIGYRNYTGVRLGRASAVLALAVHSLRGVFGLGRPVRAKLIPALLIVIMLLPAAVMIAVMAFMKQQTTRGATEVITLMGYPQYAVIMQAVIAIFLAAQSPYLVAPDLRFRVLPLYLSRPLSATDYALAKLAALTAALFLLVAVPLTLLFIGELLVDPPMPLRTGDYAAGLGGAVILAVLLASIGIALASVTPRRGLGVACVIAFYLFTSASSGVFHGVLSAIGRDTAASWSLLINPFFLVDAATTALFATDAANDYPPGPWACLIVVAVIALSVTGVLMRYRKAASA